MIAPIRIAKVSPTTENVKVSLEHAERLVNGWRSTLALVLCVLSSDDVSIAFRGQILNSDRENFTIGDSSGNSIYVAIKRVEWCDYVDGGETSELTIHFSAGGQISLYKERSTKR
jgi:hypothetical protein